MQEPSGAIRETITAVQKLGLSTVLVLVFAASSLYSQHITLGEVVRALQENTRALQALVLRVEALERQRP